MSDKEDHKYVLLDKYAQEAKIKASAYSKSEAFYRSVHRWLTYPVIITSTVASVCAGVGLNSYAILSLSLVTLLLSGFNSAIDPKNRENLAHNVSVEFNEIYNNIQQFLLENNKTKGEIKTYSQMIRELLNVWESQAPPIRSEYIRQATHDCSKRIRPSISQKNLVS